MSPELVASLRSAWEALNNRWNQWVLNYSRGQQLDVLKNLGFTTPDWEDLALLLIGALSSLALAGAAWAWLDRHRVDPWVRQLERLKKALRSLGIAAAPHEAPRTLAARVRDRLGERGEPLAARARRARDAALRPGAGEPSRLRADASLRRRVAPPAAACSPDNRGDAPFPVPPRPGPRRRQPRRPRGDARRRPAKSVEVDRGRRRRRRRSAASTGRWPSATTAFPTSSPTAGAPT